MDIDSPAQKKRRTLTDLHPGGETAGSGSAAASSSQQTSKARAAPKLQSYRILPPATTVSLVPGVTQEEVSAHCKQHAMDDALGGGDGNFGLDLEDSGEDALERPHARYQTQILPLPFTVGSTVEIHPNDCQAGLAVLADGTVALFRFPLGGFVEHIGAEEGGKRGRSVTFGARGGYFFTDAAFSRSGQELYVATKCGSLLGFRIGLDIWRALMSPLALASGSATSTAPSVSLEEPAFRIKIPGGAVAWQLIVSRNGRHVLVNSADCALRLYGADECWASVGRDGVTDEVKPRFVFQDLVSKIAWTACDFSGDGEYVVGGCNSNPHMGDRYDLYLWNTGTGALIDQLTGPQVELQDLSFHPTRSFVAVATADGLIDVWGPRMDWTAFAPDFQALPRNVEYVEKEDEFDVVVDGDGADEERKKKEAEAKVKEEGATVDVVTIDQIPVFDSDSEDENAVHVFQFKI